MNANETNLETRLPYARFDGTIVNGDTPGSRGARWVRVWIYLLNVDKEAARLAWERCGVKRGECVGLLQGREYGKAEELRRSKSNE